MHLTSIRSAKPAALLLGSMVLVSAFTSAAWACRGTAEYPEVAAKLAASSLPADKKAALQKQLDEGRALHDRAHQQDDKGLMKDSLKILDKVKGAL